MYFVTKLKGFDIFTRYHEAFLFVAWKLLGLALCMAETAVSVQTELIDGGGYHMNTTLDLRQQ